MQRRMMPDDVRAQVTADLMTGEQPAVVAKRYNVSVEAVRKIGQRLKMSKDVQGHVQGHGEDMAPAPRPVVRIERPTMTERQIAIAERVLELVEAKLIASQRLAERVQQPGFIEKQTAADLALLGEWLDRSATAVLDRLAGGSAHASQPSGAHANGSHPRPNGE